MNAKRLLLLSVLAVAVLATPAAAQMDADVGIFVGLKQLDDNDVGGADDQTQYGIGAFFGKSEWPVMIATDLRLSEGDDTVTYSYAYRGTYTYSLTIDVETTELQAGVAKFWGDRIRPYIGGGLAYVMLDGKATADFTGPLTRGLGGPVVIVDDDDSELGYYANAGVLFGVGESFTIGVDVRYSDAEAELMSSSSFRGDTGSTGKIDSGGPQYGVRFGYSW